VAIRSRTATATAASHQYRLGPSSSQAAIPLASVSSVRGTVVTYTQNSRPVFGHVRGGTFAHAGITTLASYKPAPNAMPTLITKSHNRMVAT
jgi:hypothetical protein